MGPGGTTEGSRWQGGFTAAATGIEDMVSLPPRRERWTVNSTASNHGFLAPKWKPVSGSAHTVHDEDQRFQRRHRLHHRPLRRPRCPMNSVYYDASYLLKLQIVESGTIAVRSHASTVRVIHSAHH